MKHLLSTLDLSREDAIRILDIAEEMAAVGTREVKKLPALRGRTVVNLFLRTPPAPAFPSKQRPSA